MSELSKDELKRRTKRFALRTIKLCDALPESAASRVISRQLIRCATAVGANYRSALRARSTRDFISKVGITLEEADESAYWIELIIEANVMSESRVNALLQEANELTAIFAATHKTSKSHARNPKS